jgi:hypothetical protein
MNHRELKGLKNKMPPLTEAQKRAKAKYAREKLKRLTVSFYPNEAELWEKLQAQENKQAYIKALIRKDIEQN